MLNYHIYFNQYIDYKNKKVSRSSNFNGWCKNYKYR